VCLEDCFIVRVVPETFFSSQHVIVNHDTLWIHIVYLPKITNKYLWEPLNTYDNTKISKSSLLSSNILYILYSIKVKLQNNELTFKDIFCLMNYFLEPWPSLFLVPKLYVMNFSILVYYDFFLFLMNLR